MCLIFGTYIERGKRFWATGLIVQFIQRLKEKAKKYKEESTEVSGPAEIFRIRLLEIQTAIHRVYLEVSV